MNWGVHMCGFLSLWFIVFGLVFAIFKEKAILFIAGFNSLPAKKRQLYDQKAIVDDMKKQCYRYALVLLIGTIASYFNVYLAIPTMIVFFIMFFKDVHLNANQAFEKYKK